MSPRIRPVLLVVGVLLAGGVFGAVVRPLISGQGNSQALSALQQQIIDLRTELAAVAAHSTKPGVELDGEGVASAPIEEVELAVWDAAAAEGWSRLRQRMPAAKVADLLGRSFTYEEIADHTAEQDSQWEQYELQCAVAEANPAYARPGEPALPPDIVAWTYRYDDGRVGVITFARWWRPRYRAVVSRWLLSPPAFPSPADQVAAVGSPVADSSNAGR